jgi:hypothetical protein
MQYYEIALHNWRISPQHVNSPYPICWTSSEFSRTILPSRLLYLAHYGVIKLNALTPEGFRSPREHFTVLFEFGDVLWLFYEHGFYCFLLLSHEERVLEILRDGSSSTSESRTSWSSSGFRFLSNLARHEFQHEMFGQNFNLKPLLSRSKDTLNTKTGNKFSIFKRFISFCYELCWLQENEKKLNNYFLVLLICRCPWSKGRSKPRTIKVVLVYFEQTFGALSFEGWKVENSNHEGTKNFHFQCQ